MTNCATSKNVSPLDPHCTPSTPFVYPHRLFQASFQVPAVSFQLQPARARRTHVFIYPRSLSRHLLDEKQEREIQTAMRSDRDLYGRERREALFSRSELLLWRRLATCPTDGRWSGDFLPKLKWFASSHKETTLCVSFDCDPLNADTEERGE